MDQKLLVAVTLLLLPASASAQPIMSEHGLETGDYKHVKVLIEGTGKDAEAVGLTTDRIRTHVELRLRSKGLRPEKLPPLEGPYLYVRISVSAAGAFSVQLEYIRPVMFVTDEKHPDEKHVRLAIAPTWRKGGAVVEYGADPSGDILSRLDQLLDLFIYYYLKANQK